MRDAKHIKSILGAVEAYWLRHPNLRLTQVLWALAREVDPKLPPDYTEDADIKAAVDRVLHREHNPGKFFSSFK